MECPSCDGLGYFEVFYTEFDIHDESCNTCEGTGEIEE